MVEVREVKVKVDAGQLRSLVNAVTVLLDAMREVQGYLEAAGVDDDILDVVKTTTTLAAFEAAKVIQEASCDHAPVAE